MHVQVMFAVFFSRDFSAWAYLCFFLAILLKKENITTQKEASHQGNELSTLDELLHIRSDVLSKLLFRFSLTR